MTPAVNQVECNVFFQQWAAQDFMASKGVQMEGWAPFAEGHHDLFHNETLAAIGGEVRQVGGPVVLRWRSSRGSCAFPRRCLPSAWPRTSMCSTSR